MSTEIGPPVVAPGATRASTATRASRAAKATNGANGGNGANGDLNGGRRGLLVIRQRWRALPRWARALFVLAFIAFLYYLPWLGYLPGGSPPKNPTLNLQFPPFNYLRTDFFGASNWSAVLFTCALYVLIAVGLNVVVGMAGLLDLGYIGFFSIGAYSVAVFGSTDSPVVQAIQRHFDLSPTWAVAWAACVPIALALAMISGAILGWPTLRLRGDYLAIVTLGFGEIIRLTLRNLGGTSGPNITNGSNGIRQIPGPEGPPSVDNKIFTVVDVKPWYWLALTVVIVLILLVRRLEHSRVGRSWLAIREDEDAAAMMGVHPFKFKLWAFAIGAALGGTAGFLSASRYSFIDPGKLDVWTSVLFVSMVVIGGSGNLLGVSIGAILIVYIPEMLRGIEIGDFSLADFRMLFFGFVMVLIMILRPQGLIPSRRRARELADRAQEAQDNV